MPLIKTLNILLSMRNNTQRIYERLSRGEFLSVDSSDTSIRHLYEDVEENFDDYADFFKEIGLQLEAGNGYFFFSRIGEGKQSIEQKLESFSKWLDYLDFLKTYNQSFTAGYQFRKSHLIEQISLDIELKEKAGHLYKKYGAGSYLEIVNKLLQEMQGMGFAECISEQDESFKITSAFHYAEELVNMIQIANEDEIPE